MDKPLSILELFVRPNRREISPSKQRRFSFDNSPRLGRLCMDKTKSNVPEEGLMLIKRLAYPETTRMCVKHHKSRSLMSASYTQEHSVVNRHDAKTIKKQYNSRPKKRRTIHRVPTAKFEY